jgi:hypothetical protein
VTYPWDSIEALRETLVGNHTSKSWRKREDCVNTLCNHESLKGRSMTDVLGEVVERVLKQVEWW